MWGVRVGVGVGGEESGVVEEEVCVEFFAECVVDVEGEGEEEVVFVGRGELSVDLVLGGEEASLC